MRETSVFAQVRAAGAWRERPVDDAPSAATHPGRRRAPTGCVPGRRLIVRGDARATACAVVAQATLVAAHAGRRRARRARDHAAAARAAACATASSSTPTSRSPRTARRCSRSSASGNASQTLPALRAQAAAAHLSRAPRPSRRGRRADVRVNDVAWTRARDAVRRRARRPRLRAHDRRAGRDVRAFGDGVRGARLPTGSNNVRATYRKGLGAAGNVARRHADAADDRPLGLKGVSNPLAAEGGTDPEPRERARARRSRSPARSAAPSRCSTTRTSRAPSPASPRRRPRCCRCAAGPTVASPRRPERRAALAPTSPVWQQPARGAAGERRPACRGARAAAPAEHVPPRPQGQARPGLRSGRGARRGRGGAARALLVRRARARPAGAAVRGHRGRRTRCRASSRSTSTASTAARSRSRRRRRRCRRGCSPRACACEDGMAAAGRAADARPGAARSAGGDAMSTLDRRTPLPPAAGRLPRCATTSRASRCARCSACSPSELAALEENLEQLYDDQFIETCATGSRRTSAT